MYKPLAFITDSIDTLSNFEIKKQQLFLQKLQKQIRTKQPLTNHSPVSTQPFPSLYGAHVPRCLGPAEETEAYRAGVNMAVRDALEGLGYYGW